MKLTARITGAAGISLIAVAALAHGGATGIVKERMDGMSAMAEVMKALAPMMQGTAAYDAAVVQSGAAQIADHAGEAMIAKFPEDTSGGASEAKPEIWQDWEDFAGMARQLEVFANGLESAADNGAGGMAAQGGMMGKGAMMGGQGMMGAGDMMGGQMPVMTAEQLAQIPADMAYTMVSQTCTACHSRFRAEDK